MTAGSRRASFFGCLAAQGSIVAASSLWARAGCAPSLIVIGVGVAFVPYAGLLALAPSAADRRTIDRVALGASLAFGLLLVAAPPVMSDDLYRYLWEGRLWQEGLNPYRSAPDDPALIPLRNALWTPINNKDLVSIYPPLSQLVFVIIAALGGKVWTVKLVALLGHAASVLVVSRISDRPRAALALGLNPLLLSEAALNGHFDVLTGLALLITGWALAHDRIAEAVTAVCAAIGLKAVGVALLPLFARRPKALVLAAMISALLWIPVLWWRSFGDAASGLGQFATRWRGNESLFALIQWVTDRFSSGETAALAARGVVALAFVALWLVVLRRRLQPLEASRIIVWGVLLLSPQVHPWYLGWLLPLEVAAGGFAALVWSASVLLAYAPLDRWVSEGVWQMPLWLQLLSYAVALAALALDPRRPRLRRTSTRSSISQ